MQFHRKDAMAAVLRLHPSPHQGEADSLTASSRLPWNR